MDVYIIKYCNVSKDGGLERLGICMYICIFVSMFALSFTTEVSCDQVSTI
jgi:hypothetical protein